MKEILVGLLLATSTMVLYQAYVIDTIQERLDETIELMNDNQDTIESDLRDLGRAINQDKNVVVRE